MITQIKTGIYALKSCQHSCKNTALSCLIEACSSQVSVGRGFVKNRLNQRHKHLYLFLIFLHSYIKNQTQHASIVQNRVQNKITLSYSH